jgi:hypothetical protein
MMYLKMVSECISVVLVWKLSEKLFHENTSLARTHALTHSLTHSLTLHKNSLIFISSQYYIQEYYILINDELIWELYIHKAFFP